MSFIGKLKSSSGKEFFTFTCEREARDYAQSHGGSGYHFSVKSVPLYAAYRVYDKRVKK